MEEKIQYRLRDTAIEIYKNGKMERGDFKEYIRGELYCFAEGVSNAMNQDFKCVNIAGETYSNLVDVTRTTVVSGYQPTS